MSDPITPFDNPSTLGERIAFPSLRIAYLEGHSAGISHAEARAKMAEPAPAPEAALREVAMNLGRVDVPTEERDGGTALAPGALQSLHAYSTAMHALPPEERAEVAARLERDAAIAYAQHILGTRHIGHMIANADREAKVGIHTFAHTLRTMAEHEATRMTREIESDDPHGPGCMCGRSEPRGRDL